MKKKFWQFKNEAERSELYLYGDISTESWWGDEVTPKDFKKDLDECSGPLDVHINSGGGEVFAGQAIYNMLKRYDGGDVTVYIDGLAASIASVIAMAGDRIVMPENAMLMIHNAWTYAAGNRDYMRKIADELEKLDGVIRDVYVSRTGGEAQTFADLMAAETWFTAQEAKEAGLVDEVEENKKIAACISGDFAVINGQRVDVRRYAHAEKLRDMAAQGTDNGGEGQPVQDNDTALEDQRSRFRAMKRRILDTTT